MIWPPETVVTVHRWGLVNEKLWRTRLHTKLPRTWGHHVNEKG